VPGPYVLRRGLELRIRSWGEEHVLLDERSGDTHLLDTALIDALLRLASRGDGRSAADDAGSPTDSRTDTFEDGDVVEALLRLGLIERLDR
jgi:hypothetical protein